MSQPPPHGETSAGPAASDACAAPDAAPKADPARVPHRVEDVMARAEALINETKAMLERGRALNDGSAYLRKLDEVMTQLPAQARDRLSSVARHIASTHQELMANKRCPSTRKPPKNLI